MKKILLGVALMLVANAAFAGSLYEPTIEPTVVVEQAASSSFDQGILVPVLFLLTVATGWWLL